jgi:hypothetical protein
MIDDISADLGVSSTFCYVIIFILGLTIIFAVIGWYLGAKRRKREKFDATKKVCPSCGGDNKADALLCKHCEEML